MYEINFTLFSCKIILIFLCGNSALTDYFDIVKTEYFNIQCCRNNNLVLLTPKGSTCVSALSIYSEIHEWRRVLNKNFDVSGPDELLVRTIGRPRSRIPTYSLHGCCLSNTETPAILGNLFSAEASDSL